MNPITSTFSHKTVTIPPNRPIAIDVTGHFFQAVEADGNWYLTLEEGRPFFLGQVGIKFRLQPGETFRRIFLNNPSVAPVTITFYTGIGDLQDQRVVIPPGSELPVKVEAMAQTVIDALNPPAVTGQPGCKQFTNEKWKFSGMSGIDIMNTGAVPITLKAARFPGGVALGVGEGKNWGANGRHDLIGDITVEAVGVTASASVTTVGGIETIVP